MLDNSQIDVLKAERRALHAHPEVSGQEYATQERIVRFLNTYTKAKVIKVGGTGVMATFDSGKPGKNTLFRGDTDALPIQEINTFEHRSVFEGISHKCGHDGHTAILLGLAMVLSDNPIKNGKVRLVFQPAEEDGMGAKAILADERFNGEEIDYVFALHNLPGYPKNQIVVKENEFTSNVKSIIIKLFGKTSHAAEPEKGYNPSRVIADLLLYAEENTHNHPESKDFFLMTPVFLTMGSTSYGISAGYGEVHLTLRGWSTQLMKEKCIRLESFVKTKSSEYNLLPKTEWLQEFFANENHPEAVELIRLAAKQNTLPILEKVTPFRWGEDFGLFTQKFKGAMFGIGAGEKTPALHNPDYDFPDDILPNAVAMFHKIIDQLH